MFDSKGLIAVFIVGVFFIFWQNHLARKYKKPTSAPTEQTTTQAANQNANNNNAPAQGLNNKDLKPSELNNNTETITKFDSKELSFDISSNGMGIKNAVIKTHTDRKGKPVVLGEAKINQPLTYATSIAGKANSLNFAIQKVSEVEYTGVATHDALKFHKTIKIDPAQYKLEVQVEVIGAQSGFEGVLTTITDHIQDIEKTSVFMPQFERQEFYLVTPNETERIDISSADSSETPLTNANIAAISSHYFSLIFLDKSSIKPALSARISKEAKTATVALTHKPVNYDQVFRVNYIGYVGPKSLDLLRKIDTSLVEVINFGWFSALARPILRLMQWFYGLVSNWGVAIILLTIGVRLLILPLHVMSYRSMEGMKRIQPLLTELREKYKSDPQKLNQEMLVLMRTHKVNPVGGCLPMLLQFPVFLALYQVLGQSIELYQAPFMFWITDLSLKDPFYVLPVLMSLAMFLQMKLTPSTLDPTQQKVMTFMPIIFGVFTLALPSGLTLYIFVSSLFGIVQQMYFMRNNQTQKT